jgi:outer membrane lipase/esterase
LRRSALCTALAAALALASCGGSVSTFETLVPTRFVAFGDGMSDLGHTTGVRYTVNDSSKNIWLEETAANFGLTISAQSAGGQGWARGKALINTSGAALSLAEQISAFLAANTITSNDVIVLNGGLSDMFVLVDGFKAGTIAAADVPTRAAQAGQDYAAQVRRLVDAGAKHVVFAGVYDIGKTPVVIAQGQTALFTDASTKFNEALLVSADALKLGNNALYVDAQYYVNLFVNTPTTYGFTNTNTAVCTTADASTCTASTVVSGADYSKYVFADDRYLTPLAQRLFGDSVYTKMKSRW